MSTGSISDTRIKMRPSKRLLKLIDDNSDMITEIPESIAMALKSCGFVVPAKVEVLRDPSEIAAPKIDTKLLKALTDNADDNLKESDTTEEKPEVIQKKLKPDTIKMYLYLSDIRWINTFLAKLRRAEKSELFLYDVIEQCQLELPENDIIQRNPVLEARCQRLREEQQNRDYRKMTKDVDATIKNIPEDTIAYQMKSINSQIIAVLQFVLSVVAGFVFGFLGIQLIIGDLDFGLRLLLGIMFALIIALAEIYFLAKKLNEYDDIPNITTTYQQNPDGTPVKNKKTHSD